MGRGSAPPDGPHADPQRTSRDEISILALAIAAWVAAGPIRMSRITKRRDLIAAEEVPTVFDEARIRDSRKLASSHRHDGDSSTFIDWLAGSCAGENFCGNAIR
jgi:hypothetical protein